MLWNCDSIKVSIDGQQDLQPYTWKLLKAFWQFSHFYGSYHALPPSTRRRFVNSQLNLTETQARKRNRPTTS
ncbi:hypothetical protein IQ265_05440 [Nodosilinea sp. LEGE 06152]|nr:hypothetical protein [Nodosilinea sp. LEGE 06152]